MLKVLPILKRSSTFTRWAPMIGINGVITPLNALLNGFPGGANPKYRVYQPIYNCDGAHLVTAYIFVWHWIGFHGYSKWTWSLEDIVDEHGVYVH